METLKITFERFCEYVLEKVSERLTFPAFEGAICELIKTKKVNEDVTQICVTLAFEPHFGLNITLDHYYAFYLQGMPLCDIINQMVATLVNSSLDVPKLDDSIFELESVKESVLPKLINAELNASYLEDKAWYEPIEGLAVVFILPVAKMDECRGIITLKKSDVDCMGVSVDTLKEWAISNIKKNYFFGRIGDLMRQKLVAEGFDIDAPQIKESLEDLDAHPMWAITNSEIIDGAAAILNNDVLDEAYEEIGGDLVIIPSSIHEMLIVPVSVAENTPMGVDLMVQMVNSNCLTPDMFLSNDVYGYSKGKGLSIYKKAA